MLVSKRFGELHILCLFPMRRYHNLSFGSI